MPGESLPPVVAILQGDVSQLVAAIAEAKQQVRSMDGTTGTATLAVDGLPEVLAQIAEAQAAIDAFGATRATASLGADGGGGAAAALGGAAAGGGGGGGLAALGWGGGIMGMAGFGSILSLMGLGAEHAAATIVGLAGSLGGALVGAAALAAGSLSILAVGMGSDMLVAKSAITDTTTLAQALTNITQAQQVYGPASFQAAAATAQFNYDVQSLGNTLGVLAEVQLAKAINALNAFWDQATSGARVAFVNMVTPLLSIAYTYIPLIAQAATRNFGLIQQGLVPVIAFLNGPAVSVFANLENIFAARLPVAMAAFGQGVQLVINTLDYLANQTTGSFMQSVLNFLVYLNTPTGFARFTGFLRTTITMFGDWWNLLKQIAITIYDVFKPSAGLGTNIVTTLTSMLKSLDAWITSTSGSKALHNIFTVHKTEVLELLGLLGTLLSAGGQMMLVLIPPFVDLANVLLLIANTLLHIPFVGTLTAWAVVATILWTRLKLVAIATALMKIPGAVMASWTFLTLLPTRIGLLLLSLQGMAVAIWTTTTAWVAERFAAITAWAATLGPITLIVAGIALVGVAIALLVTHWKLVSTVVGQVFGAIGGWLKSVPGDIASAFGDVAKLISSPFITAFNDIVNFWNSTIGSLHFKIPGWVPGIGGDSFSVPRMASGGYLAAGQMALVGEQGPELFVPSSGGRVMPNSRLGMNSVSYAPTVVIQGSQLGQSQLQSAVQAALNNSNRDLIQRLQAGY